MNVVDSSGWLEYFADGPNAEFFAAAIENVEELIVPVISLYEVFKRVRQQRSEGDALQVVAMMEQGQVRAKLKLGLERSKNILGVKNTNGG